MPGPLIKDDQATVVNVSDKGLVILTGCGHAGVINTINYAKKITGISRIYAIIGGFHLLADGGIYEAAIEPTLKGLKKLDPVFQIFLAIKYFFLLSLVVLTIFRIKERPAPKSTTISI